MTPRATHTSGGADPTLGIDVDESTIRAVVVDDRGTVLGRNECPRGRNVPSAVRAAATAALGAAGVEGPVPVGLAAHDPEAAAVVAIAQALDDLASGPVARAYTGLAAAVAEAWCGAAREARTVVCLVAGEHVSAGILIDGRPWVGAHNRAGSAAWLTLNPAERQDYRQLGCLEAEISAGGIARRLAWRIEAGDHSRVLDRVGRAQAITARDVFDGARGGDGVAISVVRETAKYIGSAVANIAALLDPDIVVLGGLVGTAHDLLLDSIKQEVERRLPRTLLDTLVLATSTLGDDAAAIGAARLASS